MLVIHVGSLFTHSNGKKDGEAIVIQVVCKVATSATYFSSGSSHVVAILSICNVNASIPFASVKTSSLFTTSLAELKVVTYSIKVLEFSHSSVVVSAMKTTVPTLIYAPKLDVFCPAIIPIDN